MTVTDELVANNAAYVAAFDKGRPPPTARQEGRGGRLHGCPAQRVRRTRAPGRRCARDPQRRGSRDRRRDPLARSSPFIPRTDRVSGFVYDVTTGALHEVD